jgi:hypothetical protein
MNSTQRLKMAGEVIRLLLILKFGFNAENQPLCGKRIFHDRLLAHSQLVASHRLLLRLEKALSFFGSHLKKIAKIHELG